MKPIKGRVGRKQDKAKWRFATHASAALAAFFVYNIWSSRADVTVIDAQPTEIFVRNVTCMTPSVFHNHNCARIVMDNLFSAEDVQALKNLSEKGMSVRPSVGGPTMLDLNTGYLRDTEGLVNLFSDERYKGFIDKSDFDLYRRVIGKLKGHVESSFGMPENYISFTAPTFITRLDGRAAWNPKGLDVDIWVTSSR